MSAPHRIAEAELHALVDGELTDAERTELEALLATSPAEQALVRDVRELNEQLRARYAGRLDEPLPLAMRDLLGRLPRWPQSLATRQTALAAGLLIALMAGTGRVSRAPGDGGTPDGAGVRCQCHRRAQRLSAGGAPPGRGAGGRGAPGALADPARRRPPARPIACANTAGS